MDVTNPQTPTLISFSSLSIRRDFLGCTQNFRLKSKTKCRKLGIRLSYATSSNTNFVINASSLNSETVLVAVAIATFSVASFTYFNSSFKKKKISKEPTSILILSEHEKEDVKNGIEGQKLVVGDVEEVISTIESKVQLDETIEKRDTTENLESHLPSQVSALIHEETLLSQTLESLPVVSLDSGDHVSSEKSEVTELLLTSSVLSNENVHPPLIFAAKMSELQKEEQLNEANFDSESHTLTVNSWSQVDSDTATSLQTELNALEMPRPEVGNEVEVTCHNGLSQNSVREDLYTFYEANQFLTNSISNVNGLKTLSLNTSLLDSNSFSSLVRDTVFKGEGLKTKETHDIAVQYAEGERHFAHSLEKSPHRRKTLTKESRGYLKVKDRRLLPPNSPQSPSLNGMPATKKDCSLEHLTNYHCLLRNKRLTDCVKLLEDMERVGLLDMNKVYHSRYFEACKGQKAVKEAFRFTKLIPNPTLSTFNMLMSVCASSQDSEGAFQVLQLVREAGLKVDCKLYTTLISTCAKSGKVDAMFEVFHEMVNAKVEPNVHTYGALIDGCARAAQVAKAFGAYGIMRSKNVKPDRVVFNALITACGQSGAVDRAFDVLAEMMAEIQPIDPDHVTVGALIKACVNAGKVDRAQEVYNMIHKYNIKGTPEVYTIAVNSCSTSGDWEFACAVYNDMRSKGVVPDEMFLSAIIDVAGHAGKLDAAFEVLQEAKITGIPLGIVSYSSLMGACCNAKNWEKALELYDEITTKKLNPTVSTMNALITALCDGDQLEKAMEVFSEMKKIGLCPNSITYSILLVASKRKDDLDAGLMLLSQAKEDGVAPNLSMCRCLIGMCLRRFKKATAFGEPVVSFSSGRPQIDNKWTSLALMVYRETIVAGAVPSVEILSQLLGCLQIPLDVSLRNRVIENLGVSTESSKLSVLSSLVDGFGEYDPRAFSLLEEAASLGVVPCVSFKQSPIIVDATNMEIRTAEVFLLTILKGLKHRLAAGAKLPSINILLSVDKTEIPSSKGEKMINIAGRVSQKIGAMLRRLGLPYQGNESYGKIRINGLALRRWLQPRLTSTFTGKPTDFSLSQLRLGKEITHQQRNIRTGNFSLEQGKEFNW